MEELLFSEKTRRANVYGTQYKMTFSWNYYWNIKQLVISGSEKLAPSSESRPFESIKTQNSLLNRRHISKCGESGINFSCLKYPVIFFKFIYVSNFCLEIVDCWSWDCWLFSCKTKDSTANDKEMQLMQHYYYCYQIEQ